MADIELSPGSGSPERLVEMGRLKNLSDGVFAIAIRKASVQGDGSNCLRWRTIAAARPNWPRPSTPRFIPARRWTLQDRANASVPTLGLGASCRGEPRAATCLRELVAVYAVEPAFGLEAAA